MFICYLIPQITADRYSYLDEIPANYVNVDKWMQLIKGGSSILINNYVGRKGKLWAKESYDHFARSEGEIIRITEYIKANPVKAKLGSRYRELPYMFSRI